MIPPDNGGQPEVLFNAFARGEAPPLEPPDHDYRAPSLARAEWEHINRVLDGLQAARFLTSCRKWLEAVTVESPVY